MRCANPLGIRLSLAHHTTGTPDEPTVLPWPTIGEGRRWIIYVVAKREERISGSALRTHTVAELTPLSYRIRILKYDPEWQHLFEREADRIQEILGGRALRVEHVGIVLAVAGSAKESEYAPALERAGYRLHVREPGWHEHRM